MRLAWNSRRRVSSRPVPFDVESCTGDHDRLFNELDGRAITIAHRTWRIEVYGISYDAGWRWFQLSLKGPAERALTLRVRAADDVPDIVRTLVSWLKGECNLRSLEIQVI